MSFKTLIYTVGFIAMFCFAASAWAQDSCQGNCPNHEGGETAFETIFLDPEGSSFEGEARPADAPSFSNPSESPCGDSTGASAAGRPFGVTFGTITEACRAYRLEMLEQSSAGWKVKLARWSHYAAWPVRFAVHFASGGILN